MAELDKTTSKDDNVLEPSNQTAQPTEQQANQEPTLVEIDVPQKSESAEHLFVGGDNTNPVAADKPAHNRLGKLKALLKNKKFYIPAIVIVFSLVLLIGLTNIKYSLFGVIVKKNVTVEIVDDTTLQPVSGVKLKFDGKGATTDGKGLAKIDGVHTGNRKLELEKSGYESKTQMVLVRFSTTKIEPVRIVGNGYPLSFTVKDKISGNPVKNAKLSLGGVETFTNDKGEAIARVLPTGSAKLSLTTSKDGFNTLVQEVEVKDNAPTTEIVLTPAGTVVYVSNKSKKYDVYASDLDGKNERVILAATGKEDASTSVYPSPSGEYFALVASREGKAIGFGGVQQELYVISVASGELKKVENQPGQVEWSGNTLIASVTNSDTYESKVIAYNAESKAKKEILGQSPTYVVAEGKIYYSLNDPNKPDYGLYVIGIDGGGKKKIDSTPYSLYRKTITTLGLSDYNTNSSAVLNLGNDSVEKTQGESQVASALSVVTSKDNKLKLYTRVIDSYPQLFRADNDGSKEKQLTKGANVSESFYVTSNGGYAIFYGTVGTEAGVYILSIDGGSPVKTASGHIPPRGPGGGR